MVGFLGLRKLKLASQSFDDLILNDYFNSKALKTLNYKMDTLERRYIKWVE
jgi:hypothetical protein